MTIDNFLPEAYQETWNNDDETMNSMFSTFKPKHLNIDNYTLKFDYWSSLILEIFKRKPSTFNTSGSSLILDTDAKELTLLFKRKGKVPLCLDEVLEEMINKSLITPKSQFLFTATHNPILSLFYLGFQSLFSAQSTQFIVNEVVGNMSSDLVKHVNLTHTQKTDLIYSKKGLLDFVKDKIGGFKDDEEDLEILLADLRKKGEVLVGEHQGKIIIKFKGKLGGSFTINPEIDVGILYINDTITKVKQQIHQLNLCIDTTTNEIREMINKGSKHQAKYLLLKKRKLESTLLERMQSLTTLEGVKSKIEDSYNNVELLDVYKTATTTLKTFLKSHNLNVDRVENTMDELSDVMADQGEIEQALIYSAATEIDEEALEKELDGLLEQEVNDRIESIEKELDSLNIETKVVEDTSSIKMKEPDTIKEDEKKKDGELGLV